MQTTKSSIILWICLLLGSCSELKGQVYPVKVNNLWGLINGEGELVATPEYDAIHKLIGDHAVVVRNGKYGLLNSLGKELVPLRYTYLEELSDQLILINEGGNCLEGDCAGGLWGLIHLPTGNLLKPRYALIEKFGDAGHARVNLGGRCDYEQCEGGAWGLVDSNANLLIPAEYNELIPPVGQEVFLKSENGWGTYDLNGDSIAIQPQYKSLERLGPNRLVMVLNELSGVIDNQGRTIIEPRYDGVYPGGEGDHLVFEKNFKMGLMDSFGNELIPALYQSVKKMRSAWVQVRKDDRWGLRNLRDEELMGCVLMDIDSLGNDFALVQRGPLWGVIDSSGKELVPIRYGELKVANDSLFRALEREYYKWIDRRGKVRKALKFDWIGPFENGAAKVSVDGKEGLIGLAGNWLIPAKYQTVNTFQSVAQARKNSLSEWEYFYHTDDGLPTKIRSFIVMKGSDRGDERENFTSTSSGWFFNRSKQLWGLRSTTTNRILIQPTYLRANPIAGTNFTCVGKLPRSGNQQLFGLVNHQNGQVILEPMFASVMLEDFDAFGVARAKYESDKYALLRMDGTVVNFPQASYIGDFSEGLARVNLGGTLVWREEDDLGSLQTQSIYDREYNEQRDRYQFCEGGLWGFVNAEGEWVAPAKYGMVLDFKEGVARYMEGGKWGLLNRDFQTVVKPNYDVISYLEGETPLLALGMDQEGYGFIDAKGELVVQAQFGEVGNFREGMVRVASQGKWGFANLSGEVRIPPQYNYVTDFYEGRARVRDKRFWGYIDESGNLITAQKYLRAGDFHEGLAWVQGKKFFGFIGPDGKYVIEPEFSKVGDFENGMAPAMRKGKWGMINKKGNWVVPPRYFRIGAFRDSVAVIQEKGDFGLIDAKGDFILKPGFRELTGFTQGLALARKGLEFGYLSPEGEVKIDFQFARAEEFSCGRAAFFHRGKWGFIDTAGVQIVPATYGKVRYFSENRAAVRLNGKWGFVNPEGGIAVPAIYDKVGQFRDGRAAVFRNGAWGFVNADGTVVIGLEYDAVGTFRDGLVAVQKKGKWGLLNTHGAPMTLLKYDELGQHHEGLAKVLIARKYGVATTDGRVLLESGADVVTRTGDCIQVEASDKIGYINLKGEWIWEPRN